MLALQINNVLGIGDALQFSHIPENIYHFTGKKVFDMDNCWIFDNNPFVERGVPSEPLDYIMNPWAEKYTKFGKSHAERFFLMYNEKFGTDFKNPILRHNRLYIFENEYMVTNRIIVHTQGKSEKTPLSDEVVQQIQQTYFDYEIIQIGGNNDKRTPFTQKLGLNIRETAKLIGSSAIFIGVNSGMMNLALCYPRVNKKILLASDITGTPSSMVPMTQNNEWLDFNVSYYNYTDKDLGGTMSFLKL